MKITKGTVDASGKLVLLHPNETVMEVFGATGFRDVLTILA